MSSWNSWVNYTQLEIKIFTMTMLTLTMAKPKNNKNLGVKVFHSNLLQKCKKYTQLVKNK